MSTVTCRLCTNILSPPCRHTQLRSPSHFINNAYMQGFNGDTVTFPLSSLKNKPSPSVSGCFISSCYQPTNSKACKMVHRQSYRITENITATDTWKPYSLSFSFFSPLTHSHSQSLPPPTPKPKRVILLVSYTCVDVIIVNMKYFPYGS